MKIINELELISNIDVSTLKEFEKNQLDEILILFSEMDVAKIEPFIPEELNDDKKGTQSILNKYQILAILRDIFLEYKKSGDQSVIIEIGKCKTNCFPGCVFNLQGNNSKKNFSFIINKENGSIKGVHFCSLFSTIDNEQRTPDIEMYVNTCIKEAEFDGRSTEGYDTEEFRETARFMFEKAWRTM